MKKKALRIAAFLLLAFLAVGILVIIFRAIRALRPSHAEGQGKGTDGCEKSFCRHIVFCFIVIYRVQCQ